MKIEILFIFITSIFHLCLAVFHLVHHMMMHLIITKQESDSLWTQRDQFGPLSLFPPSVTHLHYFSLEISKTILKDLANQNSEPKLG